MPGCCRTIKTKLNEVADAQQALQQTASHTRRAKVVHNTLSLLRRIFGSYKVDSGLTSAFRQEIEPSLNKVWTPEDLDDYSIRLQTFSQKVERSLHQWRGKYCKEDA